MVLLGVLHTLLLLALDNAEAPLVTVPVFIMMAVVFGADPVLRGGLTAGQTKAKHYLLGGSTGCTRSGWASAGCSSGGMLPFDQLAGRCRSSPRRSSTARSLAVVAAEVAALYLLIASRFGVNINELFAGQGIQGLQGLPAHAHRADGTLTIYPIGLDRPASGGGPTADRPLRGSSRSSRCGRG